MAKLHERSGMPAPEAILQMRESMAQAIIAGKWNTLITPIEEKVNGVRVLRYSPETPTRGIVIHFHGGGFRLGSPEIGAHYATRLANNCKVEVICPAYRLAPEHPFPSGLVDAFTIMEATHKRHGNLPLIISGESAGGGLAAAMPNLAQEHDIPIEGLVLLSPWLDLTLTASSYQTNAHLDKLFSHQSATVAAELYLQGESPTARYASPLFANVDNFPATYISTGDIEVLVDDSRQFAKKLQQAGRSITYHEIHQMEHVATVRNIDAVGARQTAEGVESFINNIIKNCGEKS